jgi:aryl-alcohol dehydrogenase-like predicted oxidoreductase
MTTNVNANMNVKRIALGCMGMSKTYGEADENESIATIHAALERGVDLLDTGDFYGSGLNELLIGRAIKDRRDKARLSVKFGALRAPDGNWLGVQDSRPAAVKNFLAYSLNRLGVDHVDVYRPARLDPSTPIEDTIGAIADMVKAGYVRNIGLSEVGPETIRRAAAVHPIADLQIEYALVSRNPERAIFPVLDELGINVTAYGILSRGLLTGSQPAGRDFRAHMPRFAGANREKNQSIIDTLARMAAERNTTPAALLIAYVLTNNPRIIAVVGARTRKQLSDALGALDLSLSPSDLTALETAVPPDAIAGTRYAEAAMKSLDSEMGTGS